MLSNEKQLFGGLKGLNEIFRNISDDEIKNLIWEYKKKPVLSRDDVVNLARLNMLSHCIENKISLFELKNIFAEALTNVIDDISPEKIQNSIKIGLISLCFRNNISPEKIRDLFEIEPEIVQIKKLSNETCQLFYKKVYDIFVETKTYSEILQLFLKDYELDTSDDFKPFMRVELIKLLVSDDDFDPDIVELNSLFKWACEWGCTNVIVALLQNVKCDPSIEDNYPIRIVCEKGYYDIAELLLFDNRVDPSTDDDYCIRWASQNGHFAIVKLLIKDNRVNPASRDNTPIGVASHHGHVEIVKLLLLDDRVDPSADNNYAIVVARNLGHSKVIKALMRDKRVNLSK